MLILSRKSGQSLIINNDIILSVVEIKKDLIKIGIEAPESVKIYRKEVFDAIQNENKRALLGKSIELPSFPTLPIKNNKAANDKTEEKL